MSQGYRGRHATGVECAHCRRLLLNLCTEEALRIMPRETLVALHTDRARRAWRRVALIRVTYDWVKQSEYGDWRVEYAKRTERDLLALVTTLPPEVAKAKEQGQAKLALLRLQGKL